MLYDAKRWDRPEAKPLEEWQRLLLQAAALIEQYGHCKGHIEDESGAICLNGALFASKRAVRRPLFSGDSLDRAKAALYRHLGLVKESTGRWRETMRWNDAKMRTGEEVIAALRGAAAVNQ